LKFETVGPNRTAVQKQLRNQDLLENGNYKHIVFWRKYQAIIIVFAFLMVFHKNFETTQILDLTRKCNNAGGRKVG